MRKVKDEQHALQLLTDDKCLSYHVWVFNSGGMDCNSDCSCYTEFETVVDALASVKSYCGGRWNEVTY